MSIVIALSLICIGSAATCALSVALSFRALTEFDRRLEVLVRAQTRVEGRVVEISSLVKARNAKPVEST